MPTISIITAAFAPSAAYLMETIQSVAQQELPPGWQLEWVVQEDGTSPSLAHYFARVPDVRYEANGEHLGIAATRNLALARASGSLVRVLDSDDVLLQGALSRVIPRFEEHDIHWAIGQADDLLPSGDRKSWQSDLPFGIVRAGEVNRFAAQHGGNWPVHCAGLMLRTESLRALGGWGGLPNDEDIVMFAALSEITDGYNEPSVIWLYRQHPNQVTRTSAWKARSVASRRAALQRATAVARTGLTFAHTATAALEDPESDIHVGPASKEQGDAMARNL